MIVEQRGELIPVLRIPRRNHRPQIHLRPVALDAVVTIETVHDPGKHQSRLHDPRAASRDKAAAAPPQNHHKLVQRHGDQHEPQRKQEHIVAVAVPPVGVEVELRDYVVDHVDGDVAVEKRPIRCSSGLCRHKHDDEPDHCHRRDDEPPDLLPVPVDIDRAPLEHPHQTVEKVVEDVPLLDQDRTLRKQRGVLVRCLRQDKEVQQQPAAKHTGCHKRSHAQSQAAPVLPAQCHHKHADPKRHDEKRCAVMRKDRQDTQQRKYQYPPAAQPVTDLKPHVHQPEQDHEQQCVLRRLLDVVHEDIHAGVDHNTKSRHIAVT